MYRAAIYGLWGAMMAVLIAAFTASTAASLVPTFSAGIVLALIIAAGQFAGDATRASLGISRTNRPLLTRLLTWVALYLLPGAGLVTICGTFGIFNLAQGLLTGIAVMVVPSLVALGELVDMSWLRRDW